MDVTNSTPKLLTPREAGRALLLSARKMKALAQAGRIQHVVIDGEIYFTNEDLAAFIQANRVVMRNARVVAHA
jgi:archaeosine-15-forming tRNA-guanine transglycosylase